MTAFASLARDFPHGRQSDRTRLRALKNHVACEGRIAHLRAVSVLVHQIRPDNSRTCIVRIRRQVDGCLVAGGVVHSLRRDTLNIRAL